MVLRGYQEKTINLLQGHLAFDDKAVIPLPGGGGKSAIAAELARLANEEGNYLVLLTNISALIPQLAEHLDEFNVKYNVIKAGSHKEVEGALITLIMEQSFHEDRRNEGDIKCDILIKDEMHIGVGQKRYEDIVKYLNPDKIIGLTFTPINEVGYLMNGITRDQIVDTISVKELIALGFLVPIKTFVPRWAELIDYTNVATSGADLNGREVDKIINTDENISLTIQSMNQMDAKNKKTLIYSSSIEHAEEINKKLQQEGYKSIVVHSKLSSIHNSNSIKRFNGGTIKKRIQEKTLTHEEEWEILNPIDCLVSVMSLSVGFDAPAAKLLVMLRATKVLRLWLQIAARVSRPFEQKEYAEILDMAQCTQRLGFLDEPIEYIEQGDKEALVRSKKKRESTVIQAIIEEHPTEVTRKIILAKIEELKEKEKTIPELKVQDLVALFDTSINPYIIVEVAHEMNRRKTGKSYTVKNINWIVEEWELMINMYPEYELRLLRTLKTMAKNKVIQGKKLAALYYSPEWLREQIPYSLKIQNEERTMHVDIDDADIPF